MGYYNSRLALWEPLIEPIERKQGDNLAFEPWDVRLELSMNEPDDPLNFSSPLSEAGEVSLNIVGAFGNIKKKGKNL